MRGVGIPTGGSMAIKLPRETELRLLGSIKRFFLERLDEDIGELKSTLVLDFCLREIGPSIYNHGVADAQAFMQERVADIDGTCHQPEFGYWTP
jgi:uncharacterized protein (DUF2164 family)